MAFAVDRPRISAVQECAKVISETLDDLEAAPERDILETAVSRQAIAECAQSINELFAQLPDAQRKQTQYASVDVAVRDVFNQLVMSTDLRSASASRLWNLLDIISILSDDEICDPPLLFYLVEELLDSQTIDACRRIFDFLETRREQYTAKFFQAKNLTILRTCNELLRRLSRAQDTSFCGRVFIFLFQSFPLGDKSSVNLRGEYHTENVTTWDDVPPSTEATAMDVDDTPLPVKAVTALKEVEDASRQGSPKPVDSAARTRSGTPVKAAPTMTADELYPVFWALQQSFNQPKRLFDTTEFKAFKTGLDATIAMFKAQNTDVTRPPASRSLEAAKSLKRKHGHDADELADSFNPKYLTSRDLFELEIGDLSFQRYILIQVLIVMDFLLSLSKKAKEKLNSAITTDPSLQTLNRSVMYSEYTLSDEDEAWVTDSKLTASTYLRRDPFFYRMVETVLSRDKNWVRWKISGCPSIARDPIAPDHYLKVRATARRATTNKRLRPTALGSLDLTFLKDENMRGGLDRLKAEDRWRIPAPQSFRVGIEEDTLDMEMARTPAEKLEKEDARASKSWRALRCAWGHRLVTFDRIEKSEDVVNILVDDVKVEEPEADEAKLEDDVQDQGSGTNAGNPSSTAKSPIPDRRPLVFAGPKDRRRALISRLLETDEPIFARSISYTTRPAIDGEVDGKEHHHISKERFSMMRDADQLFEFTEQDEHSYGTKRSDVEEIMNDGRVPLLDLEEAAIPQIRDSGVPVRCILLVAGSANDDNNEDAHDDAGDPSTKHGGPDPAYDLRLPVGDLEAAVTQLRAFVLRAESVAAEAVAEAGTGAGAAGDVDMADRDDGS